MIITKMLVSSASPKTRATSSHGMEVAQPDEQGKPAARPTPLKALPLAAAPAGSADRFLNTWKSGFMTLKGLPDNAPQNLYAEVRLGGEVVAELYNGGSSVMSTAMAGKLPRLTDPPGLAGPALAQWRAEQYAKHLGGTVVRSETAQTQAQWEARPAPEWVFDEAGFNLFVDGLRDAANRRHAAYANAAPGAKNPQADEGPVQSMSRSIDTGT